MSQNLACKIYLEAELAKLANLDEAAAFLQQAGADKAHNLGWASDPVRLSAMFSDSTLIQSWIHGKPLTFLLRAVHTLDLSWRCNGVFAHLQQNPSWTITELPVRRLYILGAEPEHLPIFETHDFNLERIVADEKLQTLPPYSGYEAGGPVNHPTALGLFISDRATLLDGSHRCYQMILNGQPTVQFCHPS